MSTVGEPLHAPAPEPFRTERRAVSPRESLDTGRSAPDGDSRIERTSRMKSRPYRKSHAGRGPSPVIERRKYRYSPRKPCATGNSSEPPASVLDHTSTGRPAR